MGQHRGEPRIPPELLFGGLFVAAVLFIAGLALAAIAAFTPPPAEPAAATITVPGPTVTISYLLERTVTPGVNGY